jgi:vancomycin aglycone glucosyltransferase
VLLAPYGTLGDVHPMMALGIALRARGHSVRLCAQDTFRQRIESCGLEFISAGGEGDAALRAEIWQTHLDSRSRKAVLRLITEKLIPLQFEVLWPASENADIIVATTLQMAAHSIAEKRRVVSATAVYCPKAIRSAYVSPPLIKSHRLPAPINQLLWRIVQNVGDRVIRTSINKERATLGLPPVARPSIDLGRELTLLAADSVLAPRPPDAPDNVKATGPWILDDPGELDLRVARFLDAVPSPVYVGFGSMLSANPANLLRQVIKAGELVNRRLLLQGGWMDRVGVTLPDSCMRMSATPHHLFFPRVAAVVHHGGAGTTMSAARAGIPQVVVPHIAEQFYWGHRVETLGLGPGSLPVSTLDARGLATAIERAISDPAMGDSARSFGKLVRTGDGTGEAVRLLEAAYARQSLVADTSR